MSSDLYGARPSFYSAKRFIHDVTDYAVGLISSFVAVLAIGLTVLAGNQSLGGNQTISRSQPIFLLSAAAVLFVVKAALYLIRRRPRISTTPGDTKIKISNDSGRDVS